MPATVTASPRIRTQDPWLVELVGPAGAGKSTLAASLPAQDPDVAQGPNLWGLPRALLVASAIELLPTMIAAAIRGRPLHKPEIGQMIRIGALRRALSHTRTRGHRTMVIDEGAVFGLAWLEMFYEAHDDPWRSLWRRREREQWAARLDAVVRLDADDPELARRIRTRAKEHMVKDRNDEEIQVFMARFRDCYDQVIGDMAARGSLAVQSLSTGGAPVPDRVARLREAIEESLHVR